MSELKVSDKDRIFRRRYGNNFLLGVSSKFYSSGCLYITATAIQHSHGGLASAGFTNTPVNLKRQSAANYEKKSPSKV